MSEKMEAIVKTEAKLGGTEFKNVDTPTMKKNEVLIKTKVVSICGTDVHIYNWNDWAKKNIKIPLIYGHEFAGEVVEKGSNVSWIDVGDFVSAEGHIACGRCYQCRTGNAHICENLRSVGVTRDGIFAEYVSIPEANVWKNDPDLPPKICSIQDPFGNAVHTVFSTDVIGKDVAIMGIGPIGAMAVSICKNIGVSRVFAVGRRNRYRINLAKKVGADYTFKTSEQDVAKEIMDITNGKGVDVVLEMSGNPNAILTGLDALKSGGTMSLLGTYSKKLTLDVSEKIVFKYATIKGITGRLMFDTWYRMNGLLKNDRIRNDLETIITHQFKFDEFEKAMQLMRSGNSGKVILYMGQK